jgi:hypothetical protein
MVSIFQGFVIVRLKVVLALRPLTPAVAVNVPAVLLAVSEGAVA